MQVSNHFRYSLYFKLTVISNLFNFNPKCRYIGGGMHFFFIKVETLLELSKVSIWYNFLEKSGSIG